MCRPMPSTTAYSIPRYSISAEPAGAGFRSRPQFGCIRTTRGEGARHRTPAFVQGVRRFTRSCATCWRLRGGLRTELKLADGAGSRSRPALLASWLGSTGAFGCHLSGPLRGNFRSASKFSAALWSKTSARCLAFSSGHTSTVDSVPSGAIRTTCHPKAYRSRFILRICAPTRPFSSPEVCHNRHRGRPVSPSLDRPRRRTKRWRRSAGPVTARYSRTHQRRSWSRGGLCGARAARGLRSAASNS
jgi:hypothetical protein